MNRALLAKYGLKFNPFSQEIPVEALRMTSRIENFCIKIERQVAEGGFALVMGPPGSGKSSALRLLSQRLSALPEISVGVLTRPQCNIPDFYRELGHLFNVKITTQNRWVGAKVLRERWQEKIAESLFRPLLLIDEAQELRPQVLNELRLLASKDLDSCPLLTVILCGDCRLIDKFKLPELIPLASRIRRRLLLDDSSREDQLECLRHALNAAGNPKLFSTALMSTLCDHSLGDMRSIMTTADELLQAGFERNACPIDEKLFLEVFSSSTSKKQSRKS